MNTEKSISEEKGNAVLPLVVCSALPDDYPTPEQIDKIEEEYRNNHWCPSCLAMFEEECVCDYDEDE